MPTQSPPKKIILLVEDDFHINSIYSIFLENEGYRVTSAHDAQEAENFLAKESFDLVLLD
ncbi:MAG TPA: response regulator transcription factor, partial [Candidatus Wirthbacteria bacterium]|nr:response regulator transcription factor [Candidatus Wirthbacteria bacterium]